MRLLAIAVILATTGVLGCKSEPKLRDEPVEVKGKVKLPGGASPKDLTISFFPQQNSPPGGVKLGAAGAFTLKLVPGKYSVYFQDEANANVPAYKSIPTNFRTADPANTVSIDSDGQTLTIDVK